MRATLLKADFSDTLEFVSGQGGADLVFTSPPYCDARTYGNDVDFDLGAYARLGDATFQALKPGGHCLLNLDAPVREWRPGMGSERGFHPWKVMLDWAERVGFRVPDRLAYGRLGAPGEYGGRFRNDWEPLFWFQKPGAKGHFDKHSVATDAKVKMVGIKSSRERDGSLYKRQASGWAVENNKRHRGTLWDYQLVGRGHASLACLDDMGHPASFPYALAIDVVRCFAPKGGLVVDPFLGSGTAAIAAFDHGCDFIGGDMHGPTESETWVQKVGSMLRERYDPGLLETFGTENPPEIRVLGL